ncbi:MAG: ABC transporter permease [Actinobacteria bacterium]|nr:ABC transporter permease [Actinomycetota bacterium]
MKLTRILNIDQRKVSNRVVLSDNIILLIVFIGIFLLFSLLSNKFYSYMNLNIMLKHMVLMGILAVGLTPLMISGGIDLSFGSNLSLSTVIMALLYDKGINLWVSIFIGVLLTILIGFINGVFIEMFGILPILFTLGMMSVLLSVALVMASFQYADIKMVTQTSQSIAIYSDELYIFANSSFLKIPIPVFILVILVIFFWIILRFTRLGRRIFAIGGNINISKLFGIRVKKIRILLYSIFGLLTGFAAIMSISLTGIGYPYSGAHLLLPVISAVVLGGISLLGGKGSIFGTLLGLLIMSVIFNGLTILNVHTFYIQTFQGLTMIIVVATYEVRRRRSLNR